MPIQDDHYQQDTLFQLMIEEALKTNLQHILQRENLDSQRILIETLVSELGTDLLDCASALLYLQQQKSQPSAISPPEENISPSQEPRVTAQPGIKMVRYRLDVGHKHQLTPDELKKVLVEESGVDKNNINNIDIQSLCTFIELPDEMPHDIFLHLKSVTINQQKLDIKRVKNRHPKKRGHNHSRRVRQRKPKTSAEASDKVYSN
jgi:DbpA RNA binding domain